MKISKGLKPRYRSSLLMIKIPAGTKHITVSYKTKPIKLNINLGDSFAIETSGYKSNAVVGTLT